MKYLLLLFVIAVFSITVKAQEVTYSDSIVSKERIFLCEILYIQENSTIAFNSPESQNVLTIPLKQVIRYKWKGTWNNIPGNSVGSINTTPELTTMDHLYKSSQRLKAAATCWTVGFLATGASTVLGLSLINQNLRTGQIVLYGGLGIGTILGIVGIANIGAAGKELELFHNGIVTLNENGVGLKIKIK